MGRGHMRSSPARGDRQAHSEQKQQCVQRCREWEGTWHVPCSRVDGAVMGVPGDGAQRSSQPGKSPGCRAKEPELILQVLRKDLGLLPAEKRHDQCFVSKRPFWWQSGG